MLAELLSHGRKHLELETSVPLSECFHREILFQPQVMPHLARTNLETETQKVSLKVLKLSRYDMVHAL